MPTALNLDGQPGADTAAVKVFATLAGIPKAAPIRSGILEILAYEGTFDPAHPTAPFHRWRFESADLQRFEFQTLLGTGYNMTLSWSPKVLAGTRLTLIARYLPPDGNPVVSAPGFLTSDTL